MSYPREGLARLLYKITRVPFFMLDTVTYPPRLRNTVERVVESLVGLLVVLYFQTWWSIPLAVFAEFLFFEIIEPFGLSGYYWERGPRDGEEVGGAGFWIE